MKNLPVQGRPDVGQYFEILHCDHYWWDWSIYPRLNDARISRERDLAGIRPSGQRDTGRAVDEVY
jgi:hypothetical protein